MKIAFIIPRYGTEILGGAEIQCRGFAERLSKEPDWQVTVLTSCCDDYLSWKNVFPEGVENINGVEVHRFPAEEERNLDTFPQIYQPLVEGRATPEQEETFIDTIGPKVPKLLDFLKSHQADYDWFVFFDYRYYTSLRGVPVVKEKALLLPEAHDEPSFYFKVYDRLLRTPAGILYNSPESKDLTIKAHGNEYMPSEIIGVGFDTDSRGDAKRFREKYDITEPYVLFLGRLEEHKGIGFLIDYFLKYKSQHPGDLKLVLLGTGSFKVPDHPDIKALGFVSEADKFDALSGALVLINPSPYESFSIIIMEAWLEGAPVIANYTCEVMKGHLSRCNGGFLFKDEESFLEALHTLVSNPDERRKHAEAGRQYVMKEYAWPVVLDKLKNFLSKKPQIQLKQATAALQTLVKAEGPPELPYSARMELLKGPDRMRIIAQDTYRLKITNVGQEAWDVGGEAQYLVSYHWLNLDKNVYHWEGQKIPLGRTLKSGDRTTVDVSVIAPMIPGKYRLDFDILRIPGGWFSGFGVPMLSTQVEVFHPQRQTPPMQYYSHFSFINGWGALYQPAESGADSGVKRLWKAFRRRLNRKLLSEQVAVNRELQDSLVWLGSRIEDVESTLVNLQHSLPKGIAEEQIGECRMHIRTPLLETGFTLSIIVVTYNRLKFLKWCLESIERSYVKSSDAIAGVEVLVCDDGGSDESLEFIRSKQWAMRVKYLYQQNPAYGPASNRNQGLVQAKGKFIFFLDVDCVVEDDFVQKTVEAFESYPQAILCPERYYLTEELNELSDLPNMSKQKNVTDRLENVECFYRDLDNISYNWRGMHSLAFGLSHQMAELVGLFDANFTSYAYEDTDYIFRAFKKQIPLNFTRRFRVFHQHHSIQENDPTESMNRFWNKHPVYAYRDKQQRIFRLYRKLERGESLNILIDPGEINETIQNSMTFVQRTMHDAFRTAGHESHCGKPSQDREWDVVLGVLSHAANAPRCFDGYEFFPKACYLVGETTQIPYEWVCNYHQHIDFMLTMTNHVREIYASSGIPWHKIMTVSPALAKAYLRKPQPSTKIDEFLSSLNKKFLFFSHFQNTGNMYQRKQWRVTLESFWNAFKEVEEVALIVSSDFPEPILAFAKELSPKLPSRLLIQDKSKLWLTDEEMADLYTRVQCYVMPTIEGWGLTQLEAMAMGTPTIGLCWGGVLDFMPFYGGHMVKVHDYRLRQCGFDWMPDGVVPSADGEHLVEVMRSIYENYDEAKNTADRFKTPLREKHSFPSRVKAFEEALMILCRQLLAI